MELEPGFSERLLLFYDVETRDLTDECVSYFNSTKATRNIIWETTISASSKCACDMTKSKLGNLIKISNFDRIDNHKSGKRVFIKKVATNEIRIVKRLLEFESG